MPRRSLLAASMALIAAAAVATGYADRLRNLAPGDPLPDFTLPTLDGGALARADLAGRAAVIVFVSADQRRSEAAASDARTIWRRHAPTDLALGLVTTDADRGAYFRRRQEGSGPQPPVAFDADRTLYGRLGLIVLPTTIVVDRAGRLAHVISSHTPNYAHALAAHVDHALGRIDDAGLAARLAAEPDRGDTPDAIVARHRATARVLRDSGMLDPAETELRAAIDLIPEHVDAQLDLAVLLMEAERPAEARAHVEAALAADPASRRGQLVRGALLFHEGDLDAARPILETALMRNADPAWTHYYLGRIRELRGDTAAAAVHYREALGRALGDRPM